MRVLEGADEYWVINGGQYACAAKDELGASGMSLHDLTHAVECAPTSHQAPAYHVTLAVSTRCDLQCPYCFQQTLGTNLQPERIAAGDLDDQVTFDSIEKFVSARMSDASATQVDLLLYGGEPLLRPRACLEALARFGPLGLRRADMTTNGVGIRRGLFADLVNAGLTDTQVSLDGWKAAHDATRSTKGGRPTYDRILHNVETCKDLGIRWQFRINMTPTNLSTLDSVIHDLAQVARGGMSQIMLAPVLGLDGIFSGTVETNGELAKQVISLYGLALELGLTIPIPGDERACVDCGETRGGTGAVIGPDGELYSCWESIGRAEFSVGHVRTGYVKDEATLSERWVHCGSFTNGGHGTSDGMYETLVAIGRLNLLKQAGKLGPCQAA